MVFEFLIKELKQFVKKKWGGNNGGACIVTIAAAFKYLGAAANTLQSF